MKKQLLIILLFPFLIFSQTNSNCDYKKEYDNGDMYEGQWRDSQYHGHGTYTWADGSRFIGQWENSIEHGFGTYYHMNGVIESGVYKNGKFHPATSSPPATITSQKSVVINECIELGFTPDTSKFSRCILELSK